MVDPAIDHVDDTVNDVNDCTNSNHSEETPVNRITTGLDIPQQDARAASSSTTPSDSKSKKKSYNKAQKFKEILKAACEKESITITLITISTNKWWTSARKRKWGLLGLLRSKEKVGIVANIKLLLSRE